MSTNLCNLLTGAINYKRSRCRTAKISTTMMLMIILIMKTDNDNTSIKMMMMTYGDDLCC